MVLSWTVARCVHTERIAVGCSSLSVVAELRPTLAKTRVLKRGGQHTNASAGLLAKVAREHLRRAPERLRVYMPSLMLQQHSLVSPPSIGRQ